MVHQLCQFSIFVSICAEHDMKWQLHSKNIDSLILHRLIQNLLTRCKLHIAHFHREVLAIWDKRIRFGIHNFKGKINLECIFLLSPMIFSSNNVFFYWQPSIRTPTMNRTEEDGWVKCPYNALHQVPYQRMPYHLMKCKEKYTGPPLDTCPFNATHLVPQGTLKEHYKTCAAYFHANRERFERRE